MRWVACCSLLVRPRITQTTCESARCSSSISCRHLLLAAARCSLVCTSLLKSCSSLGSAAATSPCLPLALTEASSHLFEAAVWTSQHATRKLPYGPRRTQHGMQVELGLSDLRRAYAELHEQLDLGPERQPPEEQQQIRQHVSPCCLL